MRKIHGGKDVRKTKWATTEHASRPFLQAGVSPHVGPGGWDCSCCAPPRGSRNAAFRRLRRILKRDLFQAWGQVWDLEAREGYCDFRREVDDE